MSDCIVARCTCGGVIFASANIEELRKENAKEAARAIRAGHFIAYMTDDEVREAKFGHTPECPKRRD